MEIQLPVNNDNILGTGNGSNIEYEIVAKYGKPLLLDTTPFTGDGFLGWYKNGGKISDEYTGFGDGDIIEARFGKELKAIEDNSNNPENIDFDRLKQAIGHMVRVIMEEHGYLIDQNNVKIPDTRNTLFSRATRYKKA